MEYLDKKKYIDMKDWINFKDIVDARRYIYIEKHPNPNYMRTLRFNLSRRDSK